MQKLSVFLDCLSWDGGKKTGQGDVRGFVRGFEPALMLEVVIKYLRLLPAL